MTELPASRQIDAIIASYDDWRGRTLAELRVVIAGAGPGIVEEVKWKKPSKPEGVPVWSYGGIVCMADTLKAAVRLTFPKGAALLDPTHLFNARLEGKTVRAIDIQEQDSIDASALQTLIRRAIDLNA